MVVNRFKNILFFVSAFVLYPLIAFLMRLRQKKSKNSQPLRVLIFPHLTRVGDLVCATPVFRAIKKAHPDSFIAVVVGKKISGVIKNNPHVDEIVVYRAHDLSGFLRHIRALRCNWSISFSGTVFSTIAALFALIPQRLKLIREERNIAELLTDRMNTDRSTYRNHTDPILHYLTMLSVLGISASDAKKEIQVSPEGERRAEEFLRTRGIAAHEKLIGISITAGNKIKEWGDEKFTELARRISAAYAAKIIIIGAPNDEARVADFIKNLSLPHVYHATDFSLEDLPSLIKRLSLYVAVDTGPIHIADALGVPFADIAGPVDPNELPPKSPHGVLVLPEPSVAPSVFAFKKQGSDFLIRRALENTDVDQVMKAVGALFR